MTDNFACQTDRRTKPVVVVGPILDESVDARRTGLIIPRIENLKLCIVMERGIYHKCEDPRARREHKKRNR